MHRIEQLMVRAKHWQIFLLVVGMCVVGALPFIGGVGSALNSSEGSAESILVTEAVLGLCQWFFLLWLWSVGTFLNSAAPPALTRKTGFFLFTILYSSAYVFVSARLFQSVEPKLLVATAPLNLFAIYCMVCNIYFVAEALVAAESGERLSFFDRLGPFLLIWIFPIGIWFIQPRVNRLNEKMYGADQVVGVSVD